MTMKEALEIAETNLKGAKIKDIDKVIKTYAKNIKYWSDRSEARLIKAEQLGNDLDKRIKKEYQKAIKRIEKEIASTYGKYLGEEISYSEMQKRLSREELIEFRSSVKEYHDKIKGDNTKEIKDELKELSTKAKITRLEALKDNINIEIKALRTNADYEIQKTLDKVVANVYNDFSKELVENEIINSFSQATTKGVKELIQTSYNSKYILDTVAFNDKMSRILPKAFITGEGVKELTKEVVKEVDLDYKRARRIVRTEINRAANKVTLDRMTGNGVDRFIYIATLDNRTSDICREMNGKIFNIQDGVEGVNVPPLHPNCRSTIAAYFPPKEYTVIIEDEDYWKQLGLL